MSKPKIVVVEDDPDFREILSAFLDDAGYEMRLAGNGLEALDLLRQDLPNLVITDVTMPDMNGLELIRRLRSHHRTAALPVMMLSALGQPPEIVAGFASGADDYITKPIDLAVLDAHIRALLARSPARSAKTGSQGAVIVFLHALGGVGATTLAVNAACLTNLSSVSGVAVLDLDPGFGDVARQLEVMPRLALAELAVAENELSEEVFARFVNSTGAGIGVVVSTTRAEHWDLINVATLQVAVERLRARYQYVFVDAPSIHSEHTLAALDLASLVCVVSSESQASLLATADLLRLLARLGVAEDRVVLFVNGRDAGVQADTAAEILGRRIDVRVGHQARLFESGEAGRALATIESGAPELATLHEFTAGLADRIKRVDARRLAEATGVG